MFTTKFYPPWKAGQVNRRLVAAQTIFNLTLAGLWLWLYRPLFSYLAIIFSREDFRTNQLVLIGVMVLIAMRLQKSRLHPRLGASPHFYAPALALTLGGSLLFLLVERFLNINTLSTSLFFLASYGLVGLWLLPVRWRQGLPAALLLVGTLPFGDHLQTFVGYPMRILTAGLVQNGLAAAGVASVGVDTILVFENGVSQVDLPCSGVKSLWTGLLFLLAATWLERRPLNRRWLLLAAALAGLLFAANLARVAVLIAVGQVAGWRLAAQMLHVPLGVLGFVAACGAALALLRRLSPHPNPQEPLFPALRQPPWLSPALAAAIAVMALAYAPRPHSGLSQPPPTWAFPAGMAVSPLPLKPDELDWLTRDGAESAVRFRFESNGLSGSMILITSATWRAHHRPERCFEVYGLSLEESRPYLVAPNFPVRLVSLGKGRAQQAYSAAYWFQSPQRTTDDYATRIWADLSPRRERWVLVSILFDRALNPNQPEIDALFNALHQVVAQNLAGGQSS
jgi:exosortase O